MKKAYWMGEVVCDICNKSLDQMMKEGVFYDAKLKTGRGWGTLCKRCFEKYNCELGLGKGQEYDVKTRELLRGNK